MTLIDCQGDKRVGSDNNDNSRSVAMYWDFENLHAGVLKPGTAKAHTPNKTTDSSRRNLWSTTQALVELGASFGPVAINRAYGNWRTSGATATPCSRTPSNWIQLFPPGASAQNGADIKLCLDATEDISPFAHVGTVIIIGGDSDYMPWPRRSKPQAER